MTITAMAQALKRSGVAAPSIRLHEIAADVVRRGGNAEDLDRALLDDRDARLVLVERYLAQVRREEMRSGEGHAYGADSHITVTPAGAQRDGEAAGHWGLTDGQTSNTRRLPGHARPVSPEARRAVAAVMAKSVLDSHRMRDGRPIGDYTRAELERAEGQSFRDAHLCRLLLRHSAPNPATDALPLREWMPAEVVENAIQKSAELQDAT